MYVCMYSSLPSYRCFPFGNAYHCSFAVLCKVCQSRVLPEADVLIGSLLCPLSSSSPHRMLAVGSRNPHFFSADFVQVTPVRNLLRHFLICHPELDPEDSDSAGSMRTSGMVVSHASSAPISLASMWMGYDRGGHALEEILLIT